MPQQPVTASTIIFRLSGDALRQVSRWQQTLDFQAMSYHFETTGFVPVVWTKDDPMLIGLKELPGPGQAIPWYGETGDGYHFDFRPEKSGCWLRVQNNAGGHQRWYPDPFPPLELHTADPIQIITEPVDQNWPGPNWAWWLDELGNQIEEILFAIDAQLCRKLVEWGWTADQAGSYEYRFIPTTVGCPIIVKNIITGQEIDLTEDVCW